MDFLPGIVVLLLVAAECLAQSSDNACSQLLDYPLRPLSTAQCHYNPDVFSTTPQMAARYKYLIENHTLVTSDGYILTMFRIRRSPNSTTCGGNTSNKSPIFMQHGILVNSECFADIAERSHAFNLANAGYDVWLGNVRGTVYSKDNVNISSQESSFWNFNLDTLAAKDVRESIQYVANATGKAGNITYIGHSMGTTIGFMYAAAFPEETQSTLQRIIMMSPVVYLNEISAAPLLRLVGPVLEGVLDLLQINVVFYSETAIQEILVKVCGVVPDICREVLNILFGTTDRFAAKDLLLYYSHWIQAVSKGQLVQYLQFVETGEFKKFDYGEAKNTDVYGQSTPPFYNLSQIELPVYLFYGGTDALATPQAAAKIYGELGSTKKRSTQIPVNDTNAPFDHIDFLFSESIEQDLYPSLFSALNGN